MLGVQTRSTDKPLATKTRSTTKRRPSGHEASAPSLRRAPPRLFNVQYLVCRAMVDRVMVVPRVSCYG